MTARPLLAVLALVFFALGTAPDAQALANRVFVSARSGNNANACDNINTPCQTFAGAVTKLNPDGELIVLDSGGYGAVTITKGVTIEAPAGVTAFIHPTSGDAITINAGASDKVILRGLVLSVGTGNGITVNSVGILNVENCFITGFNPGSGVLMNSAGQLNVTGTSIKACFAGVDIANTSGLVQTSIDHCHLDGNQSGFLAETVSPGGSTTAASNTTANHNISYGWLGGTGSGKDLLNMDFCTGSENGLAGLYGSSSNALSVARYSNCVFVNNGVFGVVRNSTGDIQTRSNNTITGNPSGSTSGTINSFFQQ